MEGRVEVCHSHSRWGTICNKQWTLSHTKVVCRNLGYNDSEGEVVQNYREHLFCFVLNISIILNVVPQ